MSSLPSLIRLEGYLDTTPLLWALREHPELWNQHKERTTDPSSPHHGLDDIWVRYAPNAELGQEAHESQWYAAAELLPVKPYVNLICQMAGATELGGVLITRIPPGRMCKPHQDHGWHAERYEKFALQVTSAPGQKFCMEDTELETRPGDIYWFDNSKTHWVTNDTPYERITMIVCLRRD